MWLEKLVLRKASFLIVLSLAACGTPSAPDPSPQQARELHDHYRRISLSTQQRASLPAEMQSAEVTSILYIPEPLDFGSFIWDEHGVTDGQLWIRVDVGRQVLSVFKSGYEIGTTVIVYGADSWPTPRGEFRVLAKLKHHRSSTYDAPMPYTLRLTDDGVSIHGSDVRRSAATHGCIGIPTSFARRLFSVIKVGDRVRII